MMTKCVKCGYVCAACLNRLDEPVDGPGNDNQQASDTLKNLEEENANLREALNSLIDRSEYAKYTELMEACETAVDIMHASVDNELIVEDRLDDVMASVQVIESAIASHGQAAATRKVETPSETAELAIDDMEPDVMRKAMQGQRETIERVRSLCRRAAECLDNHGGREWPLAKALRKELAVPPK
jgi:hypothetical protein